MAKTSKNQIRQRIHTRIRRRVRGTPQRPRLAVFRSVKHIYAQVIDDTRGQTIASAGSIEKTAGERIAGEKTAGEKTDAGKPAAEKTAGDKTAGGKTPASGGNIAGAKAIGKLVAQRAQDKGIKSVVFDRGGYHYHGRVKALAEAAREAGLEF
jgi:large subunit ribosomal protein L18